MLKQKAQRVARYTGQGQQAQSPTGKQTDETKSNTKAS